MNKPVKITILGTGAYGTALAEVLANNQQEVILYGIDKTEIADLTTHHQNQRYFGNLKINSHIKITNDLKIAINKAEFIVIAVPATAVQKVLIAVNKEIVKPAHFIIVVKGFNPAATSLKNICFSQVWQQWIDPRWVTGFSGLYGASIASELIVGRPCHLVAASNDKATAVKVRNLFVNNQLSIAITTNFFTAEFAFCLKNIMALASGLFYGLHHSDSSKGSFIAAAWNEVHYLVHLTEGCADTLLLPAVLGDFILTTSSDKSRNFRFGYNFGTKKSFNSQQSPIVTVEGFDSLKILAPLVNENEKNLIIKRLFAVLIAKNPPDSYFKNMLIEQSFVKKW